MRFYQLLTLVLGPALVLCQDDQRIQRPRISAINSRPVVIRLPRPTQAPTQVRQRTGESTRQRELLPPARGRELLPPATVASATAAPLPGPPAPPAPPGTDGLASLTPQLKEILGIAGLNGEQKFGAPKSNLPNIAAHIPDLSKGEAPNLAALSGGWVSSANGLIPSIPNFPALGPPPPGSFPAGFDTGFSGVLPGGGFGTGGPVEGLPPPIQSGSLASLGSLGAGGPLPPPSPNSALPLPGFADPGSSGLLGVLGTLARQVSQASGLQGFLQPSGSGVAPLPLPGLPRLPGSSGPPVLGLPSLPGFPLLPGGLPRNSQGQVDVVNLISNVMRRTTNTTSLSDVLPPDRLQTFADNLTETLLPDTAEVDLSKFMGRWFEGINSPRATDQRCVVYHYGGLTENGKTATFTALKIYREGSEFGQVRYSIGYAFRGGHKGSMLQMHSSEQQDPAPYWVYKTGPLSDDPFGNPQYDYAIISNWVRYPVMVLVRDPDKFKQKYETEVLRWLEDNQFINPFTRAFNLLQPASYDNCQYADSTFEVFGK